MDQMRALILSILVGYCGILYSQTERYTKASQIGLTINNVGVLGNSFKGSYNLDKAPSCEFTRGSGVEHLFEGGFWIGGIINGQEAVSTTAHDNARGYSTGSGGYEFTTTQDQRVGIRSSLFSNKAFSKDAISHEDFLTTYTDSNIVVPGTQISINNHDQPLGVTVHLESYNWNYVFSNFFVILNYTIKNTGRNSIDSVYAGIFANCVVRNTKITAAGTGGSAFYNKGGNGFNDSLYVGYTYDKTGDVGFTESYIGEQFLGAISKNGFRHPNVDTNFKVHYNAWQWSNSSNPILFSPVDDKQKYAKMTSGLNWLPSWTEAYDTNNIHQGTYLSESINQSGNRSDLVSVGPFRNFEPGDEINVTYAIVCAKKANDGTPENTNSSAQQRNLVENAKWARTAYFGEDKNENGILDPGEDRNNNGVLDRFVLPTPPNAPNVKFIPGDGELDIYWTNNAESSVDPISLKQDFAGYRIYLSKLGADVQEQVDLEKDLQQVAVYDKIGDSLFYESGFSDVQLAEPLTFEGDTNNYLYRYTIKGLNNGWQYQAAVTAFDTGDEENKLESLESSPSAGGMRVFMGTPPNEDPETNSPYAYPNPYYLGAAWEGYSQRQTTDKLIFANLPKRCLIRIFNPAGDLIAQFDHNQDYSGNDIDWYDEFGDVENSQFSGGEHAWDLISTEGQAVARGLYVFTVEDLDNNKIYKSKFTIIK